MQGILELNETVVFKALLVGFVSGPAHSVLGF